MDGTRSLPSKSPERETPYWSSENTHQRIPMKQVIVVGGTGYIGKPLIEELVADA
jgi:FlaA1/EpsC-like NDP-sugar epimerase